ncbi:MAG: hypothetical protein NC548_45285 [Lachnospiraceae bacterium]|nr:hypothetical protein [Lachnospiraceae bacterium]
MERKVIHFNGSPDMKEKIKQIAEKAEADLQAKVELSRRSDTDVREIFTAEEIDELFQRNEFFAGKVADLSKTQRHQKLAAAAKWLHANSIEVVDLQIEPVSSSHPNVIVSLEIRRLASLRDKELLAFSAMAALSDSMFISGVKDNVTRFTFGIEGVWQE